MKPVKIPVRREREGQYLWEGGAQEMDMPIGDDRHAG